MYACDPSRTRYLAPTADDHARVGQERAGRAEDAGRRQGLRRTVLHRGAYGGPQGCAEACIGLGYF